MMMGKKEEKGCPLCGHRYPPSAPACSNCGESNPEAVVFRSRRRRHGKPDVLPYPSVRRPRGKASIFGILLVAVLLLLGCAYLLWKY